MLVSRTHCWHCPMVNCPHGNRPIRFVRTLGLRSGRSDLRRPPRCVPCDYRTCRVETSCPNQSCHSARRNAGGVNARACGCSAVTTAIVNHGGHWYACRNPPGVLDSSADPYRGFEFHCPGRTPTPNVTGSFGLTVEVARRRTQQMWTARGKMGGQRHFSAFTTFFVRN